MGKVREAEGRTDWTDVNTVLLYNILKKIKLKINFKCSHFKRKKLPTEQIFGAIEQTLPEHYCMSS